LNEPFIKTFTPCSRASKQKKVRHQDIYEGVPLDKSQLLGWIKQAENLRRIKLLLVLDP
jgi:hypothetical protein